MKFSELYNMLHERYGIDHLADIARELKVTPQAVSNWKSRDRVPYKYVLKIQEKIEKLDKDNSITEKKESINTKQFDVNNTQNSQDEMISLSDILIIIASYIKVIIITPTILCIL